ncbi:MarR family winged helix-turn-helix transcriptional regulator [Streptomyces hydrogenans]|uniref:MarR family winged helix-turn-helix transcriptional regulator n=1 Tax=Streptomyces hydrogenans TaxID=1873719 RepID=UPI00381F2247
MAQEQEDFAQRDRLDARELHAWQTFMQMQEVLRGRIEQQLQECGGLSSADYTVLVVLSDAPDGLLRPYELAAALGWEKSRLHHQLTRMCKRGLVERHSGGSRAINVEITPHGRATLEQAAPSHSAHVRSMVIDPLTDEQIDQLADISATILAKLTKPSPPTDASVY